MGMEKPTGKVDNLHQVDTAEDDLSKSDRGAPALIQNAMSIFGDFSPDPVDSRPEDYSWVYKTSLDPREHNIAKRLFMDPRLNSIVVTKTNPDTGRTSYETTITLVNPIKHE